MQMPPHLLQMLQAQMAAQGGNKPLLEWNCGRMRHHSVANNPAGKYKVVGDRRKGKIELRKDPNGLLQLMWKNRANGNPDPDTNLTIFPGEWTAEHVDTGRQQPEEGSDAPKDRVFLLQCANPKSKRLFFWFQTPDSTSGEDAMIVKKLNRLLQNASAEISDEAMAKAENDTDAAGAGTAAASGSATPAPAAAAAAAAAASSAAVPALASTPAAPTSGEGSVSLSLFL